MQRSSWRRTQLSKVRSTGSALQDLAYASSNGHAAAARLLAFSLLGGIGVWGLDGGSSRGALMPPGDQPQVIDTRVPGPFPWAARSSGGHPSYRIHVGNAALSLSTALLPQHQRPESGAEVTNTSDLSSLAIGLLHLASALDDAQAQRALAVRYNHGAW
jgi:hypothetical protein